MEILYILVPSVTIPLAIALLFFFICICRNNQKSSSPPVQRQPKHVRGQNVEMSMLNSYKPKVLWNKSDAQKWETFVLCSKNLSSLGALLFLMMPPIWLYFTILWKSLLLLSYLWIGCQKFLRNKTILHFERSWLNKEK